MNQSGDGAETALRVEYDGEVAIINASGDLTGTGDRIESAMAEILGRAHRPVVIDFSGATKLGTKAIADLAVAHRMASDREARVAVVLPGVRESPGEFYSARVFEVHDTRDEALAALRGEVDVAYRFRSVGRFLIAGALLGFVLYLIRVLM